MPIPEFADVVVDAQTQLIRPLDVIQVDVFGVADLSREVQVGSDGTIDFPLIGSVEAMGRTPQQLSFAIEQRLSDSFVRDPDVTSRIIDRATTLFTVGGEVTRPGRFPIEGPITLMEAVAIGGGVDEFADEEEVLIFRTVGDERYIGVYNLEGIQRGNYADPLVYPSDIVMVGDSPGLRRLQRILEVTAAVTSPLILVERVLR